MEEKEFQDLLKQHNEALASIEKASALVLNDKQKKAFEIFKEDFIDALDVDEDGNITMSSKNILKLNSLDEQFEKLAKNFNKTMVSTLANNVSKIVESNVKYFSGLDGDAKLLPIIPKVKNAISGWLGISEGKVSKNGFIDQLVESDSAKIAIKNLAMKIVIGQQGKAKAKEELQTLIEGNPKTLGAFEKHYKTFANDLNSQIDRATSNVIRTDLKLEFAIYVGGLIETSRIFCEEHNGKIYHISEILQFDPKVGIPPNYEPISDLGGYNCRHHLRWISKAMAKAKGKDVDNFGTSPIKPVEKTEKEKVVPVKKEEKKVVEKVNDIVPFKIIPLKQDLDNIEPLKIVPFKESKEWKINKKLSTEIEEGISTITKEYDNLYLIYKDLIRKSKLFKKDIEESQKIYEKQVKNYNEIVAVSKKKNDLISERNELGKKEFLRMLDEKKFINSPLKIQKINGIDNLHEGFQIFKKIASNFELNENFSVVRLSPKKRAYFTDRTNTINITSKESLTTIIHELVHGLENNPYVLKQSVDFFNKRTAGKPTRKLNEINPAYRENELFKEGDFFNPYVGKFNEAKSSSFKQYKGLRSTEILTMGVERMLKNPYSFQKEDKEYFEFIYNLLMKDL